jgi:hypothetical protein
MATFPAGSSQIGQSLRPSWQRDLWKKLARTWVTVLSENTKLRLDPHQGKIGLSPESPQAGEAAQLEDTEAQMRRALGLYGDSPRPRIESDRSDAPQRSLDRFAPGGHRRRFVQDGDVPVTIVRRDGNADPHANRPATLVPPQQSRLQRTEAALAMETAARDRAERALADAQATIRDLQTKIGHAELAKNEAVETVRREREAHGAVLASAEEHEQQLTEAHERMSAAEEALEVAQTALSEERGTRRAVERSLREAIAARENAEALLNEMAEAPPPPPPVALPVKRRVVGRPEVPARPEVEPSPVRRRGKLLASEPEVEPEPVKWWLMTKPAAKRR